MKTNSILCLLSIGLLAWMSPASAAESKLSSKDKTFITNAGQGGATEIESSQFAERTSSDQDVKSLAKLIIKDHTKANEQLAKIATARGVTPPKSPSVKQAADILLLKAKKGVSFDKGYAKMMLKDHREVVAMFEKSSKDLDDPALRAFAEKTLPALKHHLSVAEQLTAKLGK